MRNTVGTAEAPAGGGVSLADIVTAQSNFLAQDLPHARDSASYPTSAGRAARLGSAGRNEREQRIPGRRRAVWGREMSGAKRQAGVEAQRAFRGDRIAIGQRKVRPAVAGGSEVFERGILAREPFYQTG